MVTCWFRQPSLYICWSRERGGQLAKGCRSDAGLSTDINPTGQLRVGLMTKARLDALAGTPINDNRRAELLDDRVLQTLSRSGLCRSLYCVGKALSLNSISSQRLLGSVACRRGVHIAPTRGPAMTPPVRHVGSTRSRCRAPCRSR
jgi:hypothetical protein